MECYYHPDREGTDVCGICGKALCKECGLEIAGKVYCEECLAKIVGLETGDNKQESEPAVEQDPIETEEVEVIVDDNIYNVQEEDVEFEAPSDSQEYKIISEDSPYNIRSNIEIEGGFESSYLDDNTESLYQEAQMEEIEEPQQMEEIQEIEEIPQMEEAPQMEDNQEIEEIPQIAQDVLDYAEKEIFAQKSDDDFIYPDHDYEPQTTSARQDLEDKYEKYLDDLYFDEEDIPLSEQLAKDEAQYGSLTKKEYAPRKEEAVEQEIPSSGQNKPKERFKLKERLRPKEKVEPEKELEPEILKEQELITDEEDKAIHNLSYQDGKEPMGIIDILLTIILVLLVLLVLYYILYLFLLNASYPTFIDALFALKNPQNVINAILTH
ncbi:hypothetical protein [Methanobrevibacter sp.]|uniref:hypothetical protein n=1 Tax=Methanobrevibacter sp. TaxID=66852 RepID=UPI0038902086